MTEEEFQVYRETTGRQAGNRPCVGRDLRGGAVACVTWREAEDYVSWLSDRTGASYRLPTEAEWEYVARRARAVGVFGMVGRVWEWVDDCWHEDYRGAPSVGTPWFAEEGGDCGFRGLRGGSWLDVGGGAGQSAHGEAAVCGRRGVAAQRGFSRSQVLGTKQSEVSNGPRGSCGPGGIAMLRQWGRVRQAAGGGRGCVVGRATICEGRALRCL